MPLPNNVSTAPMTWKDKFWDLYSWCKIISLGLNIMYMIRTFENIYDAGSNIASHQQASEKYAIPLQHGFQILIGCFMMFCLIVDFVILTTSKLAIADWYWRPGVFFFTFTCGNEIISITDMLLNSDAFYNTCQNRLLGARSSIVLVSEICNMQNQLNRITTLGTMVRDIIICLAYVTVGYFYIIHQVQKLRTRATDPDTAMEVMANSYRYPATQ